MTKEESLESVPQEPVLKPGPPQEQQFWRGRVELQCYADLPEYFEINGFKARAACAQMLPSQRASWIVDIFFSEMTLDDAFYQTQDAANDLADAVSYLSFAPVQASFISVTVDKARVGEPFRVLVPTEGYARSRVKVDTNKLEILCKSKSERDPAMEAIHNFRTALSDSSPYRAITDCWAAIETLARVVNEKIPARAKCDSCTRPLEAKKDPVIDRWFVQSKAEQFSEEDAIDARSKTYRLRNILSHGGRLHNRELRNEALNRKGWLETATAVAIEEITNMQTDMAHGQILEAPYLILEATFVVDGDNLNASSRVSYSAGSARILRLPHAESSQPFKLEVGIINTARPVKHIELPNEAILEDPAHPET